MTQNHRKTLKKCIAFSLTAAVIAGAVGYYGEAEVVNAQERTLPGIEQLVKETVDSGDTFHILEVVPTRADASIGYLIGGEEPVSEGRKLSELPLATERAGAMAGLSVSASDYVGPDGLFTVSPYTESDSGNRQEEIRGTFVQREGGLGHYNYGQSTGEYRMLAAGETTEGKTYRRDSKVVESGAIGENAHPVQITMAMLDGSGSLKINVTEGTTTNPGTVTANGLERYALNFYSYIPSASMDNVSFPNLEPDNYVGKQVWLKQGDGESAVYTYLGKVTKGENVPAGYITVTDGNAAAADANSLYVLNRKEKQAIPWADYHENGGNPYYEENAIPIANGTFCYFEVNENGDYHVSEAVYCDDSDYTLVDSFIEDDAGNYVSADAAGGGDDTLIARDDANFDPARATYDFIGDDSAAVYATVTYSGGIYNQEWFKKQVLNLGGRSRYEADADTDTSSEMNRMKIEVSTVTLEELSKLAGAMALTDETARTQAMKAAYCGVDLSKVDMIYLSGRGTYVYLGDTQQENMTAAATLLARLGFGYGAGSNTTRSDAGRIPVVLDYGFYSGNKAAGNTAFANLALSLLLVSDEEVAAAVGTQGNAFWTGTVAAGLESKVNAMVQSRMSGSAFGVNLFEYLTQNVYLNDDRTNGYAAKDYLTEIPSDSERAGIYSDVLAEIRYENFLSQKSSQNQGEDLKESITKASITRYILNWYMHRVIVKSELKVLDLEPCYDFGQDALTAARVKELMGLGDTYEGTIEITQMASTEFIGKVEDLNACYDLIYVGARCGNMNTDSNGETVYNDSNMNGLIYTHVGDAYDYSGESANNKLRLRDDSLQHIENRYDQTLGDAEKAKYTYRGPGNDMNSTKLEEFKQYIQAGYPVVFADKFFKVEGNKVVASYRTLDKNSYFYQLVQFAMSTDTNGNYLYWQKNVYAESQLKSSNSSKPTEENLLLGITTTLAERQNTFCDYLNLSKLTLNWVTNLGEVYRPDALYTAGAETGDQYSSRLQPIDGEYRLQYIFSLANDAALSHTSTTYDCRLFIDKNSDGRFAGSEYTTGGTGSATEELTGLEIYVRNGDVWEKVEQVTTENSRHYELRTGRVYKVSRVLPDDFTGVLPWKLVLYDNADRLVRTAVLDYTAVPTGSGRKQISILQILSDNRNKQTHKFENNNWILDNDNCGDFDYLYNKDYKQFGNLKSDTKKQLDNLADANSVFRQYISALKDYDVSVHSIYVSDLVDSIDVSDWHYQTNYDYIRVRQEKAYEYFQQYDMLIVGFADTLQLGSDYYSGEAAKSLEEGKENDNAPDQNMAVARAIRDYVESGKSILFTHDTSSYIAYRDAQAVDNNWYWGYEFNRSMRAALGLDRYGALQSYYAKTADSLFNRYYMSDSRNALYEEYKSYAEKLDPDREDAVYNYDQLKEPNTDMVLGQKEGLTKYTVIRFMTQNLEALRLNGKVDNFYFPVNNDLLNRVGFNNGSTKVSAGTSQMLDGTYMYNKSEPQLRVSEVNDGQITKYPYLITDEEQKSLKVNSTHYQWLQPNMELDKDGDGKNDIVVWYTLSDIDQGATGKAAPYIGNNIYSIDPKDVVNNYYIYSMGNVTYSGAGHRVPESTTEMKLFVNTIVAAYSSGVKAPKAEFQNSNGNQIGSIYMIYDEQNHVVIRQAGENQDEVQVKFKVTDYNVLSGERQTYVEFYKACNEGDTNGITVDGIVGKVLPLGAKKVTNAAGAELTGNGESKRYNVTNGGVYSLTYDLSEMGLFSSDVSSDVTLKSDASPAVIYMRAYTVYNNGTEQTPIATAQLSVSVEKLFELN